MTSPLPGGGGAPGYLSEGSPITPAPFGLMINGFPSTSFEQTRDSMLQEFQTERQFLIPNKDYYEAMYRPEAIGISVPENMRKLLAHVGYPRLYVDSIAERQELEGFRLGGADEADDELWDWWQANDLDVWAPLGHTDALIHGRSYITVARPDPANLSVDPSVPSIRCEPPTTIYAMIDPRTRRIIQAIRGIYGIHPTLQEGVITAATLYLPNRTIAWLRPIDEGMWVVFDEIEHNLGEVPIIQIPNRTRLSDLYGTSEITAELRSVTDAAARIMMDMQGAAEVMAIPQRLLFGVPQTELGIDPQTGRSRYDAYMARILSFENPEGKAQQFSAAELRNYTEALDALDRKAAMYTGLPPQYFSFSAQNPPSAEAIQAAEARLVKKVERKNVMFGGAWEQAMRLAKRIMSDTPLPREYFRMESIWRDPSTPTYAAKADAATKLYGNGAGVIPRERAWIDMGYTVTEREEMREWSERENASTVLGAIAAGGNGGNASKPTQTVTQTPTS